LNLLFKNKTVLITGGTRGIGAAMALAFNDMGANVIVTGTKEHENSELGNFINQNKIKYYHLDYLSESSVKAFIQRVENLKVIDVLINNAGVNKIDSITNISSEDWDWIYKVNLKGPFLLTKHVAQKMKVQSSGKIINIASIFSVVSKEKRASYSSTKWGLIGLTKAVALDLAPFNIQVNAVSPGFVDTDLTLKILGPEKIKKIVKSIPQGRLATTDEIAKTVLFLCSDNNTYITGQNIIIDGGFTCA